MNDDIYCYHCRRKHPAVEMQLLQVKGVRRWRCIRSIVASKASVELRDDYGVKISATNQTRSSNKQARSLPHCVREIFTSPANITKMSV